MAILEEVTSRGRLGPAEALARVPARGVRTDESTATFIPTVMPVVVGAASALGPLAFGASAEC